MTTLAANKPRAYEGGTRNEIPVIAADIIFEGAAVGVVDASGHARPLNAADRFAGFAEAKADNAAGAAAAINCRVVEAGKIELAVSGAVITDVGQPVYATDDDTFTFVPTSAAFVGFVHRFVSAGVVVVAFDALNYEDPWGHKTLRETLTGIKTFDAEDSGKVFFGSHAWDRIDERSITRADALTILRKGYIEGKPQNTEKGEWKVTMTRRLNRSRSAGVVTIILKNDALFVKTVMWMD